MKKEDNLKFKEAVIKINNLSSNIKIVKNKGFSLQEKLIYNKINNDLTGLRKKIQEFSKKEFDIRHINIWNKKIEELNDLFNLLNKNDKKNSLDLTLPNRNPMNDDSISENLVGLDDGLDRWVDSNDLSTSELADASNQTGNWLPKETQEVNQIAQTEDTSRMNEYFENQPSFS